MFAVVMYLLYEVRRFSFDNVHAVFSKEIKDLLQIQKDFKEDSAQNAFLYLRVDSDLAQIKKKVYEMQKINQAVTRRLDCLNRALDSAKMEFLNKKWQNEIDQITKKDDDASN